MADFKKVEGRDIGSIKVYALSTCVWCKKAKSFLKDNNIAYSYIDVDQLSDSEAAKVREEQLRHNPNGSFPTIVVDEDECIIGFDKEALTALVGK